MATGAAAKKTATKKSSTKSTRASSAKSASAKAGASKRSASTKNTKRNDGPIVRRAKSASWMAILESIVIGALGVLLLINPDGMFKVIFYVVGIFLIIKGVYKIR